MPPDFKNSELFTKDKFLTLVLARNTSTQVTTLNRINRCKYLLFCGNLQGVISYGIGKVSKILKTIFRVRIGKSLWKKPSIVSKKI